MKTKPFYTNVHFLFLTGGLLINFLLAMVYRYINAGSPWLRPSELPGFYTQGWPIMLQTFVVLYVLYYAIRHFNKKFSHNPNGFERFLRELLFVLVIGFAIMEGFRWIFVTYMVVPETDMPFLERKLKMILTIDITFLIVVYAFFTAFRIFRYLQLKNIEVARWQREYTQSQFEAVKNSLNPHFLFNSLNALSTLVHVDAALAETFIEKLSRSYRYLLEQRDKQSVPLQEELQFLDGFVFLTTQRFGKKLQVSVAPMDAGGWQLPPHTLMILLEDILQRHSMSAAKPLQVHVKKEESTLVIEHSNQPKPEASSSNNQLASLQNQFRYLAGEEILSTTNSETVILHLPLLPA